MFKPKWILFAFLVISLIVNVPLVYAQEPPRSEREEMYYRYLELHSYVKGGSIEPHWMADGSSFWYAEGAPANTIIWKVNPGADTKTPLFDTIRLRKELTSLLEHEPPYQGLPLRHIHLRRRGRASGQVHCGGKGVYPPARHLQDEPSSHPVRGRKKSPGSTARGSALAGRSLVRRH